MNLKEIKEMINLMNENNLTELEMERDGLKIRLKKGTGPLAEQIQITEKAGAEQLRQVPVAPPERAEEAVEVKLEEIKAPIVGTFYRAPSPEASPFVKVEQQIEVGQTICIIEAMKLMNEIKSEISGEIKEILVENGDPVEFGQVLFLVEPK